MKLVMARVVKTPSSPPDRLRLLSLDGGGVKGISSLLILDKITDDLNVLRKQNGLLSLEPFEVFHLAGGTSTGGLIASMLFRLRMSTTHTIVKFKEIAKELFSPWFGFINIHDFGIPGYWLGNAYLKFKAATAAARFPNQPLREAVGKILISAGLEVNEKLRDERGESKMFVCATRVDKSEAVLFRSYTPPDDVEPSGFEEVDITSAACATSAAPTFLPSMKIKGKEPEEVDFWDGAMLNNNPINQVWDARYDLAKDVTKEPIVRLVVSIGTGYHVETATLPQHILDMAHASIEYVTNTKAKHVDFRRSIARLNRRQPADEETKYYRFDARIDESVNLDDWQKMDILERDTKNWLAGEGETLIKECVNLLAQELRYDLADSGPK